MTTRTNMLSGLALAALATVTLNSTAALAKPGGGGSGGMRSFSTVRTSPVVIKQFKTVTPMTVKKLGKPAGSGVIVPPRKLATTLTQERLKPNPTTTDVGNPSGRLPMGGVPLSGGGKNALNPQPLPPSSFGDKISAVDKAIGSSVNQPSLPPGLGKSVGDALGSSPLLPKLPPVATPLPGGTPPVVTLPPKQLPPILTPPPAGTPPVVTLPPKLPTPSTPPIILPPPVVVTPPAPPVVVTPPVSVGVGVVAATEVIEPVGCTYERSVRKLPGGGLQRVIIKVCPDVVVQ